jgi:hypothetical protein
MLRCRPTPPPVLGCVLPSAGPAGLGGAGRAPVGIVVLCPTDLRVVGKPGQHLSDRLGLLLRKPAASLAAQQLHLEGEPWRP